MAIKKGCGRMEEGASVSKVLRQLADLYDDGKGFVIGSSKFKEELTAKRLSCQCRKDGKWSFENQDVCVKQGNHYNYKPGLVVSFIPESRNHNGKPMMLIGDHSDVSTICLEISEEGLFAYYVDDGVS